MPDSNNYQKKLELQAFVFLTLIVAPLLAIAIVGGYGLLVWIYQLLSGPPSG